MLIFAVDSGILGKFRVSYSSKVVGSLPAKEDSDFFRVSLSQHPASRAFFASVFHHEVKSFGQNK